jgi:hypothetical protein
VCYVCIRFTSLFLVCFFLKNLECVVIAGVMPTYLFLKSLTYVPCKYPYLIPPLLTSSHSFSPPPQVVLVLQVGVDPLDNTPRARVRGSGVPAEATELARRASVTRSASTCSSHHDDNDDNDDNRSRSRSHSSSLRRSVSDASASAGAEAAESAEAKTMTKKKKKVVVELEGWLSAALLLPPGAAGAVTAEAPCSASSSSSASALGSSTQRSNEEAAPSQPGYGSLLPEPPSAEEMPAPSSAPSSSGASLPRQANRTYAFSCVFAMQSEANS